MTPISDEIEKYKSENKLQLERISELSNCLQLLKDAVMTNDESRTLGMNSIDEIKCNLCSVLKEKLDKVEELKNKIHNSDEIKKDQENTINLLNEKIEMFKNDTNIMKEQEIITIKNTYESIIDEQKNSILKLEEENKLNSSEVNKSIEKILNLTNCQEESKLSFDLMKEDNRKYDVSIKEYNIKLQCADESLHSMKESLDGVNENYNILKKELQNTKDAKIIDEQTIEEYKDKLQVSELKLSDTLKELNIVDASNVTEDILLEKDEMITNLKQNLSVNNDILNSIKITLSETNPSEVLDDSILHDYLKTYISNFESDISNISDQLDEAQKHLNESSQQICMQEEKLIVANEKIEDLTMNSTALDNKLDENTEV